MDHVACDFCHRSEPIRDGTYMRIVLPKKGVVLICDDCHEKRDREDEEATYATWQGTEVEVV